MLTSIVINAIFMALAVYVVMLKIDIFKVVGYDVYVDVLFTLTLAYFMMGTYQGAMVAIIAGLALSGLLRFTRWFFGYKKYEGRKWVYYAREGVKGHDYAQA